MTTAALLANLRARGLRLVPAGPNLDISGPKSALTPEVVRVIRQHKADLLALLATAPAINHAEHVAASSQPVHLAQAGTSRAAQPIAPVLVTGVRHGPFL